MADLPQRRDEGPRSVSPEQLQAIVRRAAELSLAPSPGEEGISEAEVMRIGEELGLTRSAVERAIAETGVAVPAEEDGFLARRMGGRWVSASRFVPRPAAEVEAELHRYLLECEYLAVQRRLPTGKIYEKQSGFLRDLKAGLWPPAGRFPLHKLDAVEVRVRDAGEGCVVGLVADLDRLRDGAHGAGIAGGTVPTVGVGILLGSTFVPIAALAALPLLPLIWAAAAGEYRKEARRAGTKLEWILDRLEHGEPLLPAAGPLRRLLGGNR